MAESKTVKVTLTGSPIGRPERQRRTLRGLGLVRRSKTVILPDQPAIRGMIRAVAHLVRVES
jgi:large subunit ribosomal protein L30